MHLVKGCLPCSLQTETCPLPRYLTLCDPLQIDKNVERELINHRSLLHPNIIKFKEVGSRAEKELSFSAMPVSNPAAALHGLDGRAASKTA